MDEKLAQKRELLIDSGLFVDYSKYSVRLISSSFYYSVVRDLWWRGKDNNETIKTSIYASIEDVLEKIEDPDIKLKLLFHLDLF